MIYLDTSAIIKLIREERQSDALHAFLVADDTPPLFTSQLAITEVKRALHAAGEPELAADVASATPPALHVPGHRILALPLTAEVVVAAGDLLPGSKLRSLDALHAATAQQAADGLTALVTYDTRMIAAAESLAMPVLAPAPPPESVPGEAAGGDG